jgi:hypothetical protein
LRRQAHRRVPWPRSCDEQARYRFARGWGT